MGLLNVDEETSDTSTELVFFVNGKKVSDVLYHTKRQNLNWTVCGTNNQLDEPVDKL